MVGEKLRIFEGVFVGRWREGGQSNCQTWYVWSGLDTAPLARLSREPQQTHGREAWLRS